MKKNKQRLKGREEEKQKTTTTTFTVLATRSDMYMYVSIPLTESEVCKVCVLSTLPYFLQFPLVTPTPRSSWWPRKLLTSSVSYVTGDRNKFFARVLVCMCARALHHFYFFIFFIFFSVLVGMRVCRHARARVCVGLGCGGGGWCGCVHCFVFCLFLCKQLTVIGTV